MTCIQKWEEIVQILTVFKIGGYHTKSIILEIKWENRIYFWENHLPWKIKSEMKMSLLDELLGELNLRKLNKLKDQILGKLTVRKPEALEINVLGISPRNLGE